MEQKILIVDDDVAIQKLLAKIAINEGLEAQVCGDGEIALNLALNNNYDLILIDISLPSLDGFQMISMIRKQNNMTPIIIISGDSDDYNALYGLEIGADDYIVKPFNPSIIGAKIKALIRLNNKQEVKNLKTLTVGPFSFNKQSLKFYKNDVEIFLSSKELLMIKLFMENPNQVFTKESLYKNIWGYDNIDDNSIMVYISHIRSKIEDNPKKPVYLQTIWGIGYQFSSN